MTCLHSLPSSIHKRKRENKSINHRMEEEISADAPPVIEDLSTTNILGIEGLRKRKAAPLPWSSWAHRDDLDSDEDEDEGSERDSSYNFSNGSNKEDLDMDDFEDLEYEDAKGEPRDMTEEEKEVFEAEKKAAFQVPFKQSLKGITYPGSDKYFIFKERLYPVMKTTKYLPQMLQ